MGGDYNLAVVAVFEEKRRADYEAFLLSECLRLSIVERNLRDTIADLAARLTKLQSHK